MVKNKPANTQELPANTKLLKNGAVYDLVKKRIVGMKPELAEKNVQITSANAGEMQALAQSRRRELLKSAAAAAVENDEYRRIHGSDAWIVEIGAAMQRKATNIEDPKMVDAARFLFQETEIGVRQAVPEAQTVTHVHQMDDATRALLERIAKAQAGLPAGDVIDVETVEDGSV